MKQKVSAVLEENISTIQQIFGQDKTVKSHRFQPLAVGGLRCCIFFVDGMVDSIRINESRIMSTGLISLTKGGKIIVTE